MFQKISSFEVWHFVSQAMALILYTDSGYCSMEDINEDRGEDIETRFDFSAESMFTNVTNNTRFQSCEDEEDTSDDETFREYLKRAEECLSGRYRGDSSERLSLVISDINDSIPTIIAVKMMRTLKRVVARRRSVCG